MMPAEHEEGGGDKATVVIKFQVEKDKLKDFIKAAAKASGASGGDGDDDDDPTHPKPK